LGIKQRDIENLAKHLLVQVKSCEKEDQRERQRKMDENEINAALNNVPGYLGTFAMDELRDLKIRIFPSYLIVNLDKRGNEGTHWIAIALYLNDVFVCDSLGTILPNDQLPQQLIDFLHIVSFKKKLHITKQLQKLTSSLCGEYTVYFVYTMSSNHSYESFLCNFGQDCVLNDVIIHLLFSSLF